MRMVNASATLEQLAAESGWLHRLAVALVKDEATADDLVQDTYSIAATQAPTDGRPIRPWLARVLWNRVRMASRSARRRRAREQMFGELAASPARPDEIVTRIEVQRLLAGLVLELPEPQRDVLLLHYFEGLTSSQIGMRLGISPGTVRWRLKQAIDELRDRLERRTQNRAWVPWLATFARSAPITNVAFLPKLLFAAFVLLVIVGFAIRAQLGDVAWAPPARAAAHAPVPPPELPKLDNASWPPPASAALGPDRVFGAEHRRIKGMVIDGNGHGVAGADVELDCGYDDGVKLKQRTGVGGTFAFEIDPYCRYVVTARKGDARGEQTWMGPTTLFLGGDASVDLERFDRLVQEGGVAVQLRHVSLAVIHVVDAETGGPIANAKISSRWSVDDGITAVTGPDGIARVNVLLPSRVTVDADHYAYATEVLENTKLEHRAERDRTAVLLGRGPETEPPARINLDVRLNRGIAVSGTVVGPNGKAVASASVALSGPAGAAKSVDVIAKTDASGHFETKVPAAGRYALSADRRDLTNDSFRHPVVQRLGTVAVEIPVEGYTGLTAHIAPRGEIRGTVVDLSSKPVAGARVSTRLPSLTDGTIRPVVADAQGRFVIEDVVGAVDVIANRGSEVSAFQHVQVKPGERADVVLHVGAAGISGIAVDRDGASVAGAVVLLNACCEWSPMLVDRARTTTDAGGGFSFDTPRGNFVLSVKRYEDDDYEPEDDVKVTGGSHDVRLVVP